jgi:hypothetical protein
MKWRARAVAATTYHGPLQLLVMRHARHRYCTNAMELAASIIASLCVSTRRSLRSFS